MTLMLEVGWSGIDLEQFHNGILALAGVGTRSDRGSAAARPLRTSSAWSGLRR
jgi:hypothetical protein